MEVCAHFRGSYRAFFEELRWQDPAAKAQAFSESLRVLCVPRLAERSLHRKTQSFAEAPARRVSYGPASAAT